MEQVEFRIKRKVSRKRRPRDSKVLRMLSASRNNSFAVDYAVEGRTFGTELRHYPGAIAVPAFIPSGNLRCNLGKCRDEGIADLAGS